ncbi:MFS transporter [Streptomyces sp. NPDC005303]|uniref:MFS transporter n=1 Tax=Streptomyces sp. NPDC005303 TaxID=3155713 RepID=UPI0033AD2CBC
MTSRQDPLDSQPKDAEATGAVATWREAPVEVKAVIAGIFVNRLGGFLQVFLVLYLIQGGFDPVQAGTALGANGAGGIAGALLGGWLVDRIGTRRAISGSMTLTAALTAAVMSVSSYPLLLVVVTVLGAASQVYRPASAEVVSARIAARRRVMAFAMYRLALNAGTTAAPLIGAVLAAVSYPLLFGVEAAAALACAAISWRALPRDTPRQTRSRDRRFAPDGYLTVLRDARYLLFLLGMLAYAAIYISYVSVLPLAVRDAGLSTFVYGMLVSLNGLIVIACELVVTRRVQYWPHRVAAVSGIVLVAVGVAAYVLPLGVAGFVAATLVWSLGETVGSPTMVAYPAQAAARPELVSRYMGASQAVFGAGTALGPFVGVVLWSALNNAVWPLFGATGLLAAVAVAVGMRDEHGRHGSPSRREDLRER